MNKQTLSQVDHMAIKAGQTMTMLLLLTAFVLNSWELTAAVATINILGALLPAVSLFSRIYRHVLVRTGLLKPHVIPDHREPHRFAQGFSGVVTALSAYLVWLGIPTVGWSFSWLVIVLANLNVFVGFCAGCFTYYQMNRLGIPGFSKAAFSKAAVSK